MHETWSRMLVPASANWRGTAGHIIFPGQIEEYLQQLKWGAWRYSGLVEHNTASPDGAQWDATVKTDSPVDDAIQRCKNMTGYYQGLGWKGGPHFFIDDELAVVFNPLIVQGTHSPSWNGTRLGLEMVGNFAVELFDSGRGAKVRDLTVEISAALCSFRGIDPTMMIAFHKEDPRSDHDCPGKNVKKGEFISRVVQKMQNGDTNGHVVDDAPAPVEDAAHKRVAKALEAIKDKIKSDTPPDEAAAMLMQAALNANGAEPPLVVDGWPGNKTKAAYSAYGKKLGVIT